MNVFYKIAPMVEKHEKVWLIASTAKTHNNNDGTKQKQTNEQIKHLSHQ